MEILILVLLYYLSQNPSFSENIKPIMAQIKDSEQMLRFLKDLSTFADAFNCKGGAPKDGKPCEEQQTPPKQEEKKEPQSPTQGIADTFIQNILDSYFKQNKGS